MNIKKLLVLVIILNLLVASCGTEDSTNQNTANPNTDIKIEITGTEKKELATETITQPNCTGNAEVSNTTEKSRTIEHVMEVQNGASVNANGQIGFAGTDIELGATVASQFGQSYGTSETLTRSITVQAKPGSNMLHTIRQVEIWKTGKATISVGGQRTIVPFTFRSDFAIELVNSQEAPEKCELTSTPSIPTPANGVSLAAPVNGVSSIGIVLPTTNAPRWLQDEARLKEEFGKAGYNVQILFSQDDINEEKNNVQKLINQGIQVLIICPVDSATASGVAEEAKAAGVKVIAYDRLILNTTAVDYYITFDGIAVGKAQGQYLVDHAIGTDLPLYLYAGAASDNNVFLFFEGNWQALQPKIADGTFVVKNSSEAVALKNKATLTHDEMNRIINQITINWNYTTAQNLAKSNLAAVTAADKGDVFILSPNDYFGRVIADVFAADKDINSYVITGQDAEQASVQYIIDGKQSMTVLKDVRVLAQDAVTAAMTYLQGGTPIATTTYNNGAIDIPSKPSAVITIDRNNVKSTLIDSGYYQLSDFQWP